MKLYSCADKYMELTGKNRTQLAQTLYNIIYYILTVRTLNILKSYDFKNLGEVITYDRSQLLKLRHFGRKCLTEIQDLLEAYGLELGMDLGLKPEKN